MRATCHCLCERLFLSVTATTVLVLSVRGVGFPFYLFLFFFPSFNIPGLLGEEIYQKSNPQTRLKAQIKTEREIERGGGGSVQFSLEAYLIVGAVWRCSTSSIESEFLLLNSIQRYHNLKRLLLPRGFQMKPSERDF